MLNPLMDEKWRTTTCRAVICQAPPLDRIATPRQIIRDLHSAALGIEHEEETVGGVAAALVPAKAGTEAGFPLARE
ncbi:MAG TPA: hypothetical protein VL048_14820 [Xanthobacteraceae bacterium]|nr:hypothetical protein [Xanthobacteraceae bacterium]